MPLTMTATGVIELSPGIWKFEMPPHQIRHFGNTNHTIGTESVVLFRSCSYDAEEAALRFDLEDVVPINVGTSASAIGIAARESNDEQTAKATPPADANYAVGPGDREFLGMARSELSAGTSQAAEKLLLGVRARSAGDLKRGQARNFSETPDNFWYVIIQPRIDELSITVRGPVDRFDGLTGLEVKDDRGNTRFKVKSEHDVPEALKLIHHAVRKR